MCEFKSVYKHNVVRHIKLKHGQQPKTLNDILPPPPPPPPPHLESMIIRDESEESEKDNPDTEPIVPKSQNERPVGTVENVNSVVSEL